MIHSRTIGGVDYTWTEPATAGEVLAWEIRCQAYQDSPRAFIERAAAWVSPYVGLPEVELYELGAADEDGLTHLVMLCESVARSAHLPEDYVAGLRLLWARDADVEGVTPDPWCDCPRCEKTNPDAPAELCKFTGISPGVMASASKLLGVDEVGAMLERPYWFLQIQAERARIRGRKATADEQARKKKASAVQETVSMWDAANPSWRQTPRASTKVH